MFYSELVKKACNMMFEAHKNDKDKGGYPYVFHPFFLASQMDDENTVCVALLHDLIEDHSESYTFGMLSQEGFNYQIIEALKLLTHNKDVQYMDYIKAIANNPIARRVKIADLKHNLDTRRVNGVKTQKHDLYKKALSYLKNI